jgi:murein DD-endopeptidase MepM/ murein hydrolase activator NlpD
MADGRLRLLYELHLTNYSPRTVELLAVDALGADGDRPLVTYQGTELVRQVAAVGPADTGSRSVVVGGGRSAVIFVDLALEPSARVPTELHHRLRLSIVAAGGQTIEQTLRGPVVAVVQTPAPALRPPLRGSAWVAFNGLAASDHRRTLIPVDGKARIAQRFAIDWMRLGPDGRLFHGDSSANANFYGYGAEVLAVADARVADLKDGLPENVGSNERSARVVTLDNVVGNFITLDLGQGRFAVYAHLQPGSLKVKLGDRVRAGQALALLGNSGNSDAPHLHFQLVDANSPLGAEGIPYEFEQFDQLGVAGGPDVLDGGAAWKPEPGARARPRHREFPLDNAVVAFP